MGRVAVVTGGGSGIGRAICEALARDGRTRSCARPRRRRRGSSSRRAASQTVLRPRTAESTSADRSAVDRAFDDVRDTLGPIEILVTSAAISGFVPFRRRSPLDDWSRTLAVNLTGTFNCVQAALPDMVAAGWGRIVTVSSAAGQTGSPRQAHYSASKGGVIALTKTRGARVRLEGHHGEHRPAVHSRHPDAARRTGIATPPRLEVLGTDGAGRSARHRRRHRGRVRVPVLRGRRATSPGRSSASTEEQSRDRSVLPRRARRHHHRRRHRHRPRHCTRTRRTRRRRRPRRPPPRAARIDRRTRFAALGDARSPSPTDVTNAEQCQTLVDRTVRELGRVDILVNNAGGAADEVDPQVDRGRMAPGPRT